MKGWERIQFPVTASITQNYLTLLKNNLIRWRNIRIRIEVIGKLTTDPNSIIREKNMPPFGGVLVFKKKESNKKVPASSAGKVYACTYNVRLE